LLKSLERRLETLEQANGGQQPCILHVIYTNPDGSPACPLADYLKLWAAISKNLWHAVVREMNEEHGIPDIFHEYERERVAEACAAHDSIAVVNWPDEREEEGYAYLALLVDGFIRHNVVPDLPMRELEKIAKAKTEEKKCLNGK
jgi:hypothetical protein